MAKPSRKGLDPDLTDAISLEHCLDCDFRTDEWARRLQFEIVDDLFANQPQTAADVPKTCLEQESKDFVVDVRDKDPEAAVALRVAERDDQIVRFTQAQKLAEIVDLIFVVPVGEADPLVACRLEARSQGLAIAEIVLVMNDADSVIPAR